MIIWVRKMDVQKIREEIEQAELVLVGLGEEFDNKRVLKDLTQYADGCEKLREIGCESFIPAWGEFCLGKVDNNTLSAALKSLQELLKDKNYYIVSIATGNVIADMEWKHDRCVMPCGSNRLKQCSCGCGNVSDLKQEDSENLNNFFEKLFVTLSEAGTLPEIEQSLIGTCSECGAPMCFNNVYTEKYNENGYLEKWGSYMKWLQGTVNKKLIILELGVGMNFPSVIRWPFEKIAFFNQKSFFYRVNGRLHQLTEELSQKGCGISQNAIDWLNEL